MLVFGHTGITLAAAVLLNAALPKGQSSATKPEQREEQPQASPEVPASQNHSSGVVSWVTSLADRIDIRLLLIGSLLPDIIDKPIGVFFFRGTFSNGRIFCHTLLFLIVITVGGLCLYWSRKKTWLLVLSFGTFTHFILDRMWLTPQTLFWPLYGFSFERYDVTSWIQDMFHTLLTHPIVSIPELVGLAIIVWFVWLLVRRGNFYAFLRKGQV
jgi:inner membrane protein